MLGIFFVNFQNTQFKMSAIIGMLLMLLANLGYLVKNIFTEYVYKNRLLDTQTTQLFATFYAFVVGLIIVPTFFFVLQPLLLGNVSALP
jgi:drug/metabolite transporter (DMT)-like permease